MKCDLCHVAAVVGGTVVGLLCIILLVMFIVYRMRKADEGQIGAIPAPVNVNTRYNSVAPPPTSSTFHANKHRRLHKQTRKYESEH